MYINLNYIVVMKYTIDVGGRGSESFVFKLTEEQFQKLSEIDLYEAEVDEIYQILGIEDFFITEDIFFGLYNGANSGEYCWITVKNELDEIVWDSPENFNFSEVEDLYLFNDDHYLLVDDFQKGTFFNYNIEIDEEFDPEKLSAETVELLDGYLELITDIRYDGNKIEEKDWVDTRSKGYNYYLI